MPFPTVASPASGHVGTCPLAFERIFSLGYTLKQFKLSDLVWYIMPNSNSALFVQPYSLWNDAITGDNGACAKIVLLRDAMR